MEGMAAFRHNNVCGILYGFNTNCAFGVHGIVKGLLKVC